MSERFGYRAYGLIQAGDQTWRPQTDEERMRATVRTIRRDTTKAQIADMMARYEAIRKRREEGEQDG